MNRVEITQEVELMLVIQVYYSNNECIVCAIPLWIGI